MERYIVTGVELGMLIAQRREDDRRKLVNEIIDKQFIMNTENYGKDTPKESKCVNEPMTEPQRKLLISLGATNIPNDMSKLEAHIMIKELKEKKEKFIPINKREEEEIKGGEFQDY